MLKIARIIKTIYACCVLHNICVNQNDNHNLIGDEQPFREYILNNTVVSEEEASEVTFEEPEREAGETSGGTYSNADLQRNKRIGREKRDALKMELWRDREQVQENRNR
ncbi:hypothetical protein ABG067_007837, partial [Albugo candida]